LTASVDTLSAVPPAVQRDRQRGDERQEILLVDVVGQPVGIVEQADKLSA
jgi:hypothetical protein